MQIRVVKKMTFEKFIKKMSEWVAAVVVFFLAGGMYLSQKGFVWDNGEIVFVGNAKAQEQMIEYQPPVIPDNFVLPDEHSVGKADAPVVLYEYSSFGCSHCADFHNETLPKLKKKYAEKGLLRVVYVPFPIDKISMDAALLAECVPADKYFDFVDLLYKRQREWLLSRNSLDVLAKFAKLNGVGAEKIDGCLKNDEVAREILANRQTGITQLGIQGTPSFVLSHEGKSELISGVRSYEEFKELISSKLPHNETTEAKKIDGMATVKTTE